MPDIPATLAPYLTQAQKDKQAAIEWARTLLEDQRGWAVMDLETSGKFVDTADIVQIGVLAPDGVTLLDSLVKPPGPIPSGATAVHGITDEMVSSAPTLAELWPEIVVALSSKVVIVFNKYYDPYVLNGCRRRAGLPKIGIRQYQCAMLAFAAYVGEPDLMRGGYKWQKLPRSSPGVVHGAIGDCLLTLELMRGMARWTGKENGDSQ